VTRPLLIGRTVGSGRATRPASTEARRAPAPSQRVQGWPDGEHALVQRPAPPRTATANGALASVAHDGRAGAHHAAQRLSIEGGPAAAGWWRGLWLWLWRTDGRRLAARSR